MAVCPNCNQDHDKVAEEVIEKMKEDFPQMMLLENAFRQAVAEKQEVPEFLASFAEHVSETNTPNILRMSRDHNLPPHTAVQNLASLMFTWGFMVACKTRAVWGEKFGTTELPSAEEAKEEFDNRMSHTHEYEIPEGAVEATPEVIDSLRKLGVDIPDDFDGKVMVINGGDFFITPPDEEGETRTGMYL